MEERKQGRGPGSPMWVGCGWKEEGRGGRPSFIQVVGESLSDRWHLGDLRKYGNKPVDFLVKSAPGREKSRWKGPEVWLRNSKKPSVTGMEWTEGTAVGDECRRMKGEGCRALQPLSMLWLLRWAMEEANQGDLIFTGWGKFHDLPGSRRKWQSPVWNQSSWLQCSFITSQLSEVPVPSFSLQEETKKRMPIYLQKHQLGSPTILLCWGLKRSPGHRTKTQTVLGKLGQLVS